MRMTAKLVFQLPGPSRIWPHAFLTPHVAGSQGNEVARLGLAVTEELERLLAGLPLVHRIEHAEPERAA